MASRPVQAPLLSLLLFIAINYVVGYALGQWLTQSTLGAIGLAFATPCLSLLAIVLFGVRPQIEDKTLDEA
jgi:Mg2+/Co2+ transporter CorB